MFIKTLSIRNFRNFKATSLSFKKECVNTIVGENSSGKTNVFEAMRLILDDTLPYYKRFLLENDFHRGLGSAFGHWVIVSLEFDEILVRRLVEQIMVYDEHITIKFKSGIEIKVQS